MVHSASAVESAGTAADHFFTVAGARLRYRDQGRGPTVLCVHGWTLDLEMWDPQAAALCDRWRVVRLDRRGHGLSEGVSSTEADVADLLALCDHLALREVSLIGMSQGARVAAQAAATSRRVWALILDGPPPLGGGSETDVPLERYRALVRDRGMSDFRREWARHPLTQLRTHDAGAHALLGSALARYSGNDLRAAPRAEASDLPARLAELRVPTLILSGQHDLPTRIRAADELARELAAERAVIADAGHLANLDCADAYNECCRHFLGRCAPVCHSS